MFVETIYETGNRSVAFYKDEAEARSAIEAHHERAKNGEPGGPYGGVAERVKKVLIYDEHPGTLNESGLLPVEEVKSALSAAIDALSMGGQISNTQLAAAVRNLSDPHVDEMPSKQESMYKMQEKGELTGAWSE
jgi:hypothetical protein